MFRRNENLFRLMLRIIALVAALAVISGCAATPPPPTPPAPTSAPITAPPTAPVAVQPTVAPTTAAVPTTAAAPTVAAATKAPEPTKPPTVAPPSGTLVYGLFQDAEALDPSVSVQPYNYTISNTMFDTLVRLDDQGNVVPWLAESWQLVNSTQMKFNLRKGVKFHDGTPFTSASVKFSFEHILDPALKSRQAATWQNFDHVETPDDYTAIVVTKKPMGTLFANMALTYMIPVKTAKPLNDFPIGTGPFKFVEWKKDDHITVEANTDYWGGAPKLAKITFRPIPVLSTRISALERGEVDITEPPIPSEEFDRLKKAGIQIINQPASTTIQMWLGVQGPLADIRVRQAIDLAIDRNVLIKDLLSGQAYPLDGCVAPGVFGYSKMAPLVYDQAKAKQLMKDAGYANGFDLEFKFADGMYLKSKEVNQVIASQLAAIGVRVKVTPQDQALWLQDLMALNWQEESVTIGTMTGDADYATRRLWLSDNKRIQYKNPKLDAALAASESEMDQAKRLQMLKDACQIVRDEVPIVFLYSTTNDFGINPRVKNYKATPNTITFLDKVSVEPPK